VYKDSVSICKVPISATFCGFLIQRRAVSRRKLSFLSVKTPCWVYWRLR